MTRRRNVQPRGDTLDTVSAEFDDSAALHSFLALTGRRPEPATAEQIRTVVRRLRVLLGEALEQSRRVGVDLTPPKLVALCDELLHEAREPGYRPAFNDSVEGFFLGGLFDELVLEPSNIFDTVTSTDGREFYVPLSAEQWIACLEVLRLSLAPQQ